MKYRLLFCVLLNLFFCASDALAWHNFWLTQDQQAEKLMGKGQFAEAEKQFQRKDWRAVAAYRAGHYQQAAQDFSSMENEQGYYNLGNALAQLGQYQKAINAYDQALQLNPNNKDALFNRQLLTELLKKENDKQKNNSENTDNKQPQDQHTQQESQDKNQKQSGQAHDKGSEAQSSQNQQEQPSNQDADIDKEKGQNSQTKKEQDQDQPAANEQPKKSQQESSTQNGKKQEDKNDTDSALNASQIANEREKKQAREQWLRLIPDDPGGLLREKFWRDHQRRQEQMGVEP